jgi:hypothetical protein
MKVLIIYQLNNENDRNTISENLYSFKKMNCKEICFHYLNVFGSIPFYIKYFKYDAVILHYTYLGGERFNHEEVKWEKKINGLTKMSGYKVMIPQDEYDHTDRLWSLCKKANIKEIYSCFTSDADILKAYPPIEVNNAKVFSVLTGYVDEDAIMVTKTKIRPYHNRPIDIGYRARKLPAYFGKHGQLKYELVELFSKALENSDFTFDISNTNQSLSIENPKLVKLGNNWYEFLLNCKAFIGCEGGSSLLDVDGSIKEKVIEYSNANPNASFNEIESNCFPGQDFNIRCFAISPRHFEAALCKTLQILVEGEYGGIFMPWKHYVPLKRDFSNLNEILTFIEDKKKCQKIIDNAYNDIILSKKYTYNKFVSFIIDNIKQNVNASSLPNKTFIYFAKVLDLRNRFFLKFEKLKIYIKYFINTFICFIKILYNFSNLIFLRIKNHTTF